MNLEDLKLPFEENEIEWRIGQCGVSNGKVWASCLAYISARAAQDRLDEVCSPEGWRVHYEIIQDKAVLCDLSIKDGEGEWIHKQDGAEMTEIEAFKGGLSSAFKRAASAWGIGRYLYDLPVGFASIVEKGTPGAQYGKTKDDTKFYWTPPSLPSWALPKKENKTSSEEKSSTTRTGLETAPVPPKDESIYSLITFKVGQFAGKNLLEVLNIDSTQDYSYAEYWHKNRNGKISNEAKSYLELCEQEGVFNVVIS